MLIDTRGVELNETVFLNKEGKFLFKIDKWEEDGFTAEGAAKFKMFFKGVEVGTKEPLFMHSEMFNLQQNSLWRIKQLEVALKAPEVYEVESLIGRYVIANVKQRSYTKKDGTEGTSFNVVSWEYSALNDKMPPIQEAKQNSDDVVDGDIDEDSIPF